MPDDVGVTDAALAETVARVLMDGHLWAGAFLNSKFHYERERRAWRHAARAAIAAMQPALDAAREAGRREGLEQAAIEIARLKGGLASVAELLGSDLGHFRRAESVEAFLRGEKVDWMEAADAR